MQDQQIISTLSEEALFALAPHEFKVVQLLFGIGIAEHSTDDVAKQFGMTTDMVETVKRRALRKLQQPGYGT
jgi:DNA-directed RNA polymerase sigma subunit (sigma70/sigma32)